MFKFCTQCGAKMPQENLFCTQCGAKFPVNTDVVQQPVAKPKVIDIAPPQNTQNVQVTRQVAQNTSANKMAQDEFMLGKEFMNTSNPLHDYEKAIIHLKNAVNLGIKQATVYIALSHLYLAADIIKANPAMMVGNANILNTVNSAMAMGNMPNHTTNNMQSHGKNHMQTAQNNQSNGNGSSTLQNIGKYAAAAAVGAVAGSMLHSATASAAEKVSEDVPGNITTDDLITPDLQAYADETLPNADEYLPPIDEAADHIQAYDDVTENETVTEEEPSAADSIEPAEDDSSFFDSDDNSDDDSSLFDDLF